MKRARLSWQPHLYWNQEVTCWGVQPNREAISLRWATLWIWSSAKYRSSALIWSSLNRLLPLLFCGPAVGKVGACITDWPWVDGLSENSGCSFEENMKGYVAILRLTIELGRVQKTFDWVERWERGIEARGNKLYFPVDLGKPPNKVSAKGVLCNGHKT